MVMFCYNNVYTKPKLRIGGFTLVELVVVVAVIGILATITTLGVCAILVAALITCVVLYATQRGDLGTKKQDTSEPVTMQPEAQSIYAEVTPEEKDNGYRTNDC